MSQKLKKFRRKVKLFDKLNSNVPPGHQTNVGGVKISTFVLNKYIVNIIEVLLGNRPPESLGMGEKLCLDGLKGRQNNSQQ